MDQVFENNHAALLKLTFECIDNLIKTNISFTQIEGPITLEYDSETNTIIYSSKFHSSEDYFISPKMAPDYFFNQEEIIIQVPETNSEHAYLWV